ncbi:MAG: hypothetical protein LUI02_06675 [Clostridiales bacterium]|nr:hypothetical protein [Clostridiales bacterium]
MKRFTAANLKSAFALIRKDLKSITEATQATFDEIYENAEKLNQEKVMCAYDEETETLTLSPQIISEDDAEAETEGN